MNKSALHGKLKAKEGMALKLAEILLKAATLLENAKGCNLYLVSTDPGDLNSVWITEVWDSKLDHQNSLKNKEIKALIGRAMPLLDGLPEKGQELEVFGGKGIN